jgi:hypothetical protein
MASGDSQLSNSARLLAAQEFNRRALEQKAQQKLAKAEADRQQELERTTRQNQANIDNARNIVEKQKAEQALAEQLAQKSTQDKITQINLQAETDRQNAIFRTLSTPNIEVLSGRQSIVDTSGKVIGLSTEDSASAQGAKNRIITEIQRREIESTKVTDLERFLANESALASGQVSASDLETQIAERKARGLSKTPQQAIAEKRLRDQQTLQNLGDRNVRKIGRGITILSAKEMENQKSLGRSQDYTNPNFISAEGSSASFQARAKDNSLGQINSQLDFLKSQRISGSASQKQNEQVARAIADGSYFSALSDNQLLTITSGQSDPSNRRVAQSASEQKIKGVIKPSKELLGDEAKALSKANPFSLTPSRDDPFSGYAFGNFGGEDTTKIKERPKVAQGSSIFSDTQTKSSIDATRKRVNPVKTQNVDDLEALGRNLNRQNAQRGAEIEAQNKNRKPRQSVGMLDIDFGFGVVPKSKSSLPQQLTSEPRQEQDFYSNVGFLNATGQDKVRSKESDPTQRFGQVSLVTLPDDSKLIEARKTQAETKALKESGGTKSGDNRNFGQGALGNFNQGLISSSAGLIKSEAVNIKVNGKNVRTVTPKVTEVNTFQNIFGQGVLKSAQVNSSGSSDVGLNVGDNNLQIGNQFTLNLTDSLGLGISDSATPKKKLTQIPPAPAPINSFTNVFGGNASNQNQTKPKSNSKANQKASILAVKGGIDNFSRLFSSPAVPDFNKPLIADSSVNISNADLFKAGRKGLFDLGGF